MKKIQVAQVRLYCVIVVFGLLAILSCSKKPLSQTPKSSFVPLEKEAFIVKPFGYEPTIKNFRTNLPSSFKLQVYSMKNIHNPSVIDTIYRFHQKKSELFIYKNVNNRELFFAGNIYNGKIQLRNGVRVGMTRKEFFQCFTNMKPGNKDTIRVSSKRATNSMNFIFKGNKLTVIKIDNYID